MKHMWVFVLLLILVSAGPSFAQSTAFTYQGKLSNNSLPANGAYDMQFKLFDALASGNQVGATLTFDGIGMNPPTVSVTTGIFTVTLDFGPCSTCFNGAARFLEIAVRPTGGGSYTMLSPRQPITSTPYALKTQNLTFNGPFNDGVSTIFAASNTFAGEGAGVNTTVDSILGNPLGKFNSFLGAGAGQANTSGFENVFFGYRAGQANTTGISNTFIGDISGVSNTTAGGNTFIGSGTNFIGANPTGENNTLLGFAAKVNSGVNNATAIGANAFATQSNSLILGSLSSPGTKVRHCKQAILPEPSVPRTAAPGSATREQPVVTCAAMARFGLARFYKRAILREPSAARMGAPG